MNAEILYNEPVAPGYFRLGLRWSCGQVTPGQFVMLRVADSLDPLLRRPFGVYDLIGPRGKYASGIVVLYRVIGKATGMLSAMKPGERVDVLGPLGNGFDAAPDNPDKLAMVAGGIGIAPFYLLSKVFAGTRARLLFGVRTKAELAVASEVKKTGVKVKSTTEDGSAGVKGYVTELLKKSIDKGSIVYACGPLPMLSSVAALSKSAGASCYVSLERTMACGIGVCLGCAVKRSVAHKPKGSGGYGMVCSEGPVFNAEEIEWESL